MNEPIQPENLNTHPVGHRSSAVVAAPSIVNLFGLEISNISVHEAIHWIAKCALLRQKTLLNFVNAHCINVASKDVDYYRVLRTSTRLFPDGSGISKAMQLRGMQLRENLNGTDLFPPLCELAAIHGLSIYLLGAAPGVAAQAATNMQQRYPNLHIAGSRDGFFSAAEEAQVITDINRSGADILLVAMGVPRQEKWLADNLDKLHTSVNMGVGGLFDFFAEKVSRAPLWLRSVGMEWTWRLLQEPRRMWRRYLLGNPAFMARAWRDARSWRRRANPATALQSRPFLAKYRRIHLRSSARAVRLAKRILDIAVSASALLVTSPLFAATALAIRVESAGPVFFSQTRVGLHGRVFRFWKFRSMYSDAEARKAELVEQNEMDGGVLFKIKQDPRITRVGRFIRRFSIDELPQLWNVLRGDMSLVGPRPALPNEVAQYTLSERRRLLAQPGITCTWQVSGRSEIPFEKQVLMDMEYIHSAHLATDIKLLLKTVPAVFYGRGAY